MSYKQKVWIELESKQENEKVSHKMLGEWFVKDKAFYIKYTERTDAGEIRHLLRYQPSELKITRKGAIEAEQVFRVGQRWTGYYDNKMIKIAVEAFTYRLEIMNSSNQALLGLPSTLPFSLVWEYDLFVDDQSTGKFSIRLKLKEVNAS